MNVGVPHSCITVSETQRLPMTDLSSLENRARPLDSSSEVRFVLIAGNKMLYSQPKMHKFVKTCTQKGVH